MNEPGQVETSCLPSGMISTRDLTNKQAIVLRLLGQVPVRMYVTAAAEAFWRQLPPFQCLLKFDAHLQPDAVYLNIERSGRSSVCQGTRAVLLVPAAKVL